MPDPPAPLSPPPLPTPPHQPSRSVGQVRRLLAAAHALPVELSIELDLHARSEVGGRVAGGAALRSCL